MKKLCSHNGYVSFLSTVREVVVSRAHRLMFARFKSYDVSEELRWSIVELRIHFCDVWIVQCTLAVAFFAPVVATKNLITDF